MEFLIRLTDKINYQVICQNPIHYQDVGGDFGASKKKVIFDDPSDVLPCPQCGETEWLFRKNLHISKKGHIITFKLDGWGWGENERKHYAIIRIPNVTETDAITWTKSNIATEASFLQQQQTAKDKYQEYREAKKQGDPDARDKKEERNTMKDELRRKYVPRCYKFNFDSVQVPQNQMQKWLNEDLDIGVLEMSESAKLLFSKVV